MPRGNLSGLCVVRVRHDSIVGAWVNEFGVQAFDFTYERQRQRIRLAHLIPPLRGFFLRRILKKDFQTFVPHFATGQAFSHQNRHGIRYDFVPLPLDTTQTVQDSTSSDTTAP